MPGLLTGQHPPGSLGGVEHDGHAGALELIPKSRMSGGHQPAYKPVKLEGDTVHVEPFGVEPDGRWFRPVACPPLQHLALN